MKKRQRRNRCLFFFESDKLHKQFKINQAYSTRCPGNHREYGNDHVFRPAVLYPVVIMNWRKAEQFLFRPFKISYLDDNR
jgi:hypothetical protein